MKITKKECDSYEKIRVSGVTNMMMVTTVCELSGLSEKVVLYIMQNYSKLNEKFNFSRNSDGE